MAATTARIESAGALYLPATHARGPYERIFASSPMGRGETRSIALICCWLSQSTEAAFPYVQHTTRLSAMPAQTERCLPFHEWTSPAPKTSRLDYRAGLGHPK